MHSGTSDFVELSEQLTFTAGTKTPTSIESSIEIKDDMIAEENELFSLILSTTVERVILYPANATVTLVEDTSDCMLKLHFLLLLLFSLLISQC